MQGRAGGKSALLNAPLCWRSLATIMDGCSGILLHLNFFTLRGGLISGAICWFGFVLTTMTVNNAFARRRPILTALMGRAGPARSDHRRHCRCLGPVTPPKVGQSAPCRLRSAVIWAKVAKIATGPAGRGESAMSDEKIYEVPADWRKRAFIDEAKYQEMYARSIKDPNGFWAEQAKRVDWIKPFSKVKNSSYDPHNVSIKWFEDGTLNAAYNCVDRHLAKRGEQTAIIWEGDDPKDDKKITYKQLHAEVCKFANVLKARGVKKGDRVTIYMPMIGSRE
jgi:hypothetical protein